MDRNEFPVCQRYTTPVFRTSGTVILVLLYCYKPVPPLGDSLT